MPQPQLRHESMDSIIFIDGVVILSLQEQISITKGFENVHKVYQRQLKPL